MPAPSLTYTLSNGTTADASQVMQNFNDLLNGYTDGSKDLSISALTCAGNATFNGNVQLGNATSDTVTYTSRIASSLVPSASATNDLGTSSLTWKHIYLDNGATDGGAVHFDASSTKFLKSNAAGTELDLGGFSYFDFNTTLQKNTFVNYNISTDADVAVSTADGNIHIVMNITSSTDREVTLPAVATEGGRVIKITRKGSGTGKVTINPNASETIDSATTFVLFEANDSITITNDATQWFILDKKLTRVVARYTYASASTISQGVAAIFNFSTKVIDVPGVDNVTTGASWKFTAPRAGIYLVNARLVFQAYTGWVESEKADLRLYLNNTTLVSYIAWNSDTGTGASSTKSLSGFTTISLAAGDYIDVRLYFDAGADLAMQNDATTNFIDIVELS